MTAQKLADMIGEVTGHKIEIQPIGEPKHVGLLQLVVAGVIGAITVLVVLVAIS